MIDFSEIVESSVDEAIRSIFAGAKQNPELDDLKSQSNVYGALMTFSSSLLEAYHNALKAELSGQGINI